MKHYFICYECNFEWSSTIDQDSHCPICGNENIDYLDCNDFDNTNKTDKKNKILEIVNEKLKDFGKLLFLTKSGSHLYGTNTPESDEDYVGVFIAYPEFYLGLKNVQEVDCSVKSKDESGKNTKDAIDIKVYELKQFLKLAGDVNPNIIELLFAHTNKNAVIYNTPEFKQFQNNYHLFINQRVFYSFQGYAKQQFKKGVTKAQNFNKLKDIIEILDKFDDKEILAVAVEKEPKLKKLDKGKHIEISGLSFQKNLFIKKVKSQMKEKIKISSHRAKMWEEYGYDTKFFMHLFRLLQEGRDLIEKGKLEFPLKNTEFLMNVRNGVYDLEVLQNLAEKEFNDFQNLDITKLPKKANWNKIEELLIKIVKEQICSMKQ